MSQKSTARSKVEDNIDQDHWKSIISDVPLAGVSLNALQEFVNENSGKLFYPTTEELSFSPSAEPLIFEKLTTSQVCLRIIKPATMDKLCSHADLLLSNAINGVPSVSKATVFVSHAWKYLFIELFECVKAQYEFSVEKDSAFFWIDIFVVNQHPSSSSVVRDSKWFAEAFKGAIQAIGLTFLVLLPWQSPMPLTRSWCLWEIYSTLNGGTSLIIKLPASQEAEFIKVLTNKFDEVVLSMSKIDLRKSEAFIEADRLMIYEAVETAPGGFTEVNSRIHDRLRLWLSDTGKKALAMLRSNSDDSLSAETLLLMNSLAKLLFNQSRLEESQQLYEEALRGRRSLLGEAHSDTLKTMTSFAHVLRAQKKFVDAEKMYRQTLGLQQQTFGDAHLDTYSTKNHLANLLRAQDRLEEAESLYVEALGGRREILGSKHADTLISLNGLALLYKQSGRFLEAEEILKEVLETQRETLGNHHPDTLWTMNNLGDLLRAAGKLLEAKEVYIEALQGRKEILGESHPLTVQTKKALGSC